MKKYAIQISLFVLLFAAINFAGAELLKFTARSVSGNVVLNWQTLNETNLKFYVVERKTVSGGFVEIATVDTRADRNYEYTDASAFKATDLLYVYRLKIVDNDNSVSYSGEVTVHHNVSSVKRTWGSIKALFR